MMHAVRSYAAALTPTIVSVLLLIIGGSLFLHHTYRMIMFIYGPAATTAITEGHDSAHVPRSAGAHDAMLHAITNAGLFKSDQTTSMSDGKAAPPSLSLALRGVFAGSQGTPSYAIIEESGSSAKSYRVGDVLGNGHKVSAIYADRVVISDGKSQTVLYLREHAE